MISLKDNHIFSQNYTTLKKASINNASSKKDSYMTECEFKVVDFDKVKESYIKGLKLQETPSSNDCLLEFDNELYFIEFKDGNMKDEIHKVRRKIFESLLIFSDITTTSISYTRKNVNYILVYNKIKSKEFIQKRRDKKLGKTEVQESSSLKNFSNMLSELSNYNMDIFELKKSFCPIYFKNVFTYDKEQFNNKFVPRLEEYKNKL